MADYDWAELTGTAVERLRKPRVTPVPEPIIRQALRSYKEGVVLEHKFASVEHAAEFAKLMKKAGAQTEPPMTVQVVIDPEEAGDETVVRWRAGEKRGRK